MTSIITMLLVVGVIAYIAWTLYAGGRTANQNALDRATRTQVSPVAAFAWPARDEYEFEVVGESHYQPTLKALHSASGGDSATGTAILVPEDTNPHDDKAVRVTVQGLTVGYLSRDDARSYRRRLAAKKLGMVPASCGIVITGGHQLKDGTTAHFGAELDMKPFD